MCGVGSLLATITNANGWAVSRDQCTTGLTWDPRGGPTSGRVDVGAQETPDCRQPGGGLGDECSYPETAVSAGFGELDVDFGDVQGVMDEHGAGCVGVADTPGWLLGGTHTSQPGYGLEPSRHHQATHRAESPSAPSNANRQTLDVHPFPSGTQRDGCTCTQDSPGHAACRVSAK